MEGHNQPKLEKEMQKSNTNASNKELERHLMIGLQSLEWPEIHNAEVKEKWYTI